MKIGYPGIPDIRNSGPKQFPLFRRTRSGFRSVRFGFGHATTMNSGDTCQSYNTWIGYESTGHSEI